MNKLSRFETRSDMDWHRLSDKTRTRRANVGDIKFSIAWGPNEKTMLTVQIEEGFALTKYLQSSLAIKTKARGFFSKKKEEDKGETLPSAFLKFSIDSINKRKTKVVKVGVVHARAPAARRAHSHSCEEWRSPLKMQLGDRLLCFSAAFVDHNNVCSIHVLSGICCLVLPVGLTADEIACGCCPCPVSLSRGLYMCRIPCSHSGTKSTISRCCSQSCQPPCWYSAIIRTCWVRNSSAWSQSICRSAQSARMYALLSAYGRLAQANETSLSNHNNCRSWT